MSAVLRLWDDRRLRFLVVGGWNTVFGYGVFVGLYALLGGMLHYLAVAVLAHGCAVSAAFAAHRVLVFRSRGPWVWEFVRYNLSLAVGLVAGLVGLWALVSILGLHPIAAQAAVTVLVVALSYVLHSRFSFAQPKAP